jgi:hypothetical protein
VQGRLHENSGRPTAGLYPHGGYCPYLRLPEFRVRSIGARLIHRGSGVFRGGGGGGATAPPLWRGLCWRRSGAAPPPLGVIRGAVGGVWQVFEEVYGVKWKKCEKLLKKRSSEFLEVGLHP